MNKPGTSTVRLDVSTKINTENLQHLRSDCWCKYSAFRCLPYVSAVCRTRVIRPSSGDLEKKNTHPVSIRPPGSLSVWLWRSQRSSPWRVSTVKIDHFPCEASKQRVGGIYCQWDLLLVPICKGITRFFPSVPFYLFIPFPNSFLIHLKENKKSSQTHKYCQSG